MTAIAYTVKRLCAICERRMEDLTVIVAGADKPVGVCETCWIRMDDERPRHDEPEDAT